MANHQFWASPQYSPEDDSKSGSSSSSDSSSDNNNSESLSSQRFVSNKNHSPMFGAVVGDVIGSTYEHHNCKSERQVQIFRNRSRCTDDSVLTFATAKRLVYTMGNHVESSEALSYTDVYQEFGKIYPHAEYGKAFKSWVYANNPEPYGSWGNGSAMRVSPVGWVAHDLDWCMSEAKRSSEVSHDHPEAIKGAQAVACAVFLGRIGKSKEEIKAHLESSPFGYDLDRKIQDIRPNYKFDVSCQGSVPEAILAFLESTDFESSIRKAISLGGDSDTIACITGAIAHAYYGEIPTYMINYCRTKAMDSMQLQVHDEFWEQYHTRWNIVDKVDSDLGSDTR